MSKSACWGELMQPAAEPAAIRRASDATVVAGVLGLLVAVTPAKAGVHASMQMDSRVRGNDDRLPLTDTSALSRY
ncbi:hypothetical protein HNQ60_001711 [Povalibacter uvarum]|uniref:Uncharacterized protein n=1 Tax=Povalibacter uvarum TaxID=732238 RepID=A0A841HJD4_9GAMM|nr:hypothetical protein [Povalibacter uvarum]